MNEARDIAHPNGFELDCFAVDETVSFAATVRKHVAACEPCRRRVNRFRADRAHFVGVLDRTMPAVLAKIATDAREKRRGWKYWWTMLPLAAGLALVSFGSVALDARRELHPALAVKGDPAFTLYVQRQGRASPFVSGGSLSPGDPIRFVLRPSGLRYLLLVSIDASGRANTYFPYGGTSSVAIDDADEVTLPGSIELDATPGPERVFALFSREPLEATAALEALVAIGRGGPDAIRREERLAVPAEAQSTVLFENTGVPREGLR
jgi:hypothetical protein